MFKFLLISTFLLTSIYTIPYTDIDGGMQNFGNFQGKKILIVNIATGSSRVSQLEQLQQLYQQHQDSLVIIAFPSNSFANEPRTNAEVKQFCQSNYGATFHLAAKGNVKDPGQLPIYHWLSTTSENGVMNGAVQGDFQKFLIDKNGQLIGVFAPDISPMDSILVNGIAEN